MSHSTYNKMWVDTHQELSDLLVQELPTTPQRPERDRHAFFQTLATLYMHYLQIFRKLDTAYDQIVHPQKRRVARVVLDGVMGRLVELKNEMVQTEFSEFHYMDDILQDLKLTPADLEIPIPKYFLQETEKILEERKGILAKILSNMEIKAPPPTVVLREISVEEAVRLIQVSERARQGRLRASFMHEIQLEEERQRRVQAMAYTDEDRENAALLIQRVWRGYAQRMKTKKEREEEMVFLGMSLDPQLVDRTPNIIRAEMIDEARRAKREEYETEYQESLDTIKERLLEVEGPDMKEQMKDQIRQWFLECHDNTGKFPDYPEDEDGGSSILFVEKTPDEIKKELAQKQMEEQSKKGKNKGQDKEKEKREKEKQKEKERKEKERAKQKGKGKEEQYPGLQLGPSNFVPDLQLGQKTYKTVWRKRDERMNFDQRHEAELIKEEKRKEVEAEIRTQVDAVMREELETLKMVVDRDQTKYRKGKKAAKKKGKKGGKKKKEKDLTPDRVQDSLYEELVLHGILKPAQDVKLVDFVGDFSYLGTTLRMADIEPMPSMLDVRVNIALYAILPLGSTPVHEKGPHVKSILLAGPAGTGKKMLVHAICTETGANLFDLSPNNIANKYPGKSGLQMMMHLVLKVARLMQPSVIWIGDTEKIFYKKVPKEERGVFPRNWRFAFCCNCVSQFQLVVYRSHFSYTWKPESDPKRLKKDLSKALKLLKPEDRVLIVGTSNNPFAADVKALCKVYEKIILVPRPDYASRYVLWPHLIKTNGGIITDKLDFSNLAKVSDGYSSALMTEVVKSVLNEKRIALMDKKPLVTGEFLIPLARADPIFREEEEAFKDWYSKTPLGKKHLKASQGNPEEDKKKGRGKGMESKMK